MEGFVIIINHDGAPEMNEIKQTKTCVICGKEKNINMFSKMRRNKDGHRGQCKQCIKKSAGKYYEKNRNYILSKQKKYQKKHKERKKEYDRVYIEKNREKRRQYRHEYYLKNKKETVQKNNQKRRETPYLRIKDNLRKRTYFLLKEKEVQKGVWFSDLLGCNSKTLRDWLESKFHDGMTWDNYGRFGWHVDHIVPICAFNILDIKEQRKAFHYTNLQPLWWYDNLSKGSKVKIA